MIAPRTAVVLAASALALSLAGCGEVERASDAETESTPTSTPTVDPDSPVLVADGEVLIRCGSVPFKPSAMTGPLREHAEADEIDRALEALIDELVTDGAAVEVPPPLAAADEGSYPWRVLGADGQRLELAVGSWTADGPGEGAMTIGLERDTGDGLRVTGWGDCRLLEPALAGGDADWADVRLAGRADPASSSLEVKVSERFCASSRDPSPYLQEPYVVDTGESVTIYWTSTPPRSATCPTNPWVRRSVELSRPLGERAVYDGSLWPPKRLGR